MRKSTSGTVMGNLKSLDLILPISEMPSTHQYIPGICQGQESETEEELDQP